MLLLNRQECDFVLTDALAETNVARCESTSCECSGKQTSAQWIVYVLLSARQNKSFWASPKRELACSAANVSIDNASAMILLGNGVS